jgi:PPIC-type PPIASE domain
MRILLLVCLLLPVSLAWSQVEPGLPATVPQETTGRADHDDDKQPLPDSASAVAPDAAVLTIKGLCTENTPKSEASSPDAACQTVVTRAQFEQLANAIHPNMPPTTKRQLASSYPRLLAMAREAEQRGLDRQTHFEEMIAFARLQILAQDLVHSIEDAAAQVPAKDIEDYYQNNSASFERASLERIIVPNIRQAEEPKNKNKDKGGAPSDAQAKEQDDKEAMKKEAEELRTHAAAGEDFTKLQKEAYESAGLNTPPPPTSLVKTRRASLPPAHQSAFEMKPGEVSPVISDAGGYYIYKLVAKEIEPLGEAEAEIHKTLEKQRMRAMMQKVQDSVTTDVNQAYFGPPSGQRRSPVSQGKTNQTGAPESTETNPNPK